MKTDEATGRIPNATLEDLVAELTAAAYVVALRHGAGGTWLDLELELWNTLTDVASRWHREAHRPAVARRTDPGSGRKPTLDADGGEWSSPATF